MYRRPWEIMKALNLEQPLREIAEIPESDEELSDLFRILIEIYIYCNYSNSI